MKRTSKEAVQIPGQAQQSRRGRPRRLRFSSVSRRIPKHIRRANLHQYLHLLVAVVLPARATDVGVDQATAALFAVADTPAKMVTLGEDRLRDYIKTIGLFQGQGEENVIALSKLLIERRAATVPRDRAALEALPGGGGAPRPMSCSTSASASRSSPSTRMLACRTACRWPSARQFEAVEAGLEKIAPDRFKLHVHHWLILHGRYVCKARKPLCEKCLIADLCRYKGKTV